MYKRKSKTSTQAKSPFPFILVIWQGKLLDKLSVAEDKSTTSKMPLWDSKFYDGTLCIGHSLSKIPHDLLDGGKQEMDHPLEADVVRTRHSKNCETPPPQHY